MYEAHSRLGANIIARELQCPESLMFGTGDILYTLHNGYTLTSNGKKSIEGQHIDSEIKYQLSNEYKSNYEYQSYNVNVNINKIIANIKHIFENYVVKMDNTYNLTPLFKDIPNVKMYRIGNLLIARFENGNRPKEFTFTAQPDFVGYKDNTIKILDIKTNGSSYNIDKCNIDYEIQLKVIALAAYLRNNIRYNRNITNFECIIYNVQTEQTKTYTYTINELNEFKDKELLPLLQRISELEPYYDYIDIFQQRDKGTHCINCGNKYCPHSMYGRKLA